MRELRLANDALLGPRARRVAQAEEEHALEHAFARAYAKDRLTKARAPCRLLTGGGASTARHEARKEGAHGRKEEAAVSFP